MNKKISEILEKNGVNRLITAMILGSIGYYNVRSAWLAIQRYIDGERRSYSERCWELYGCDLEKMILEDIDALEHYEKYNPKLVQNTIAGVEEYVKKYGYGY